ncbi:MAG TPA: hypothetical protein DDY14_06900 [Chromatiaceae bacterium]|nr:MAG: hypothetical protein N838_05230 [Thiohalocapsa sp. PB-PSB1]HBG95043.1 hypothetical protein [Chromatiaceae bacterium]HCS89422.1 hypothetical protein [Chromatiaceae bacterium]
MTIAMLSAIAIGLSACGDGDQAEPEEQTSETSMTEQEQSAVDAMKEQAEAAKQSLAEAGDQAKAAVASTTQAMAEQGSAMMEAANEKSSEMADAATDKARQMIASVKDFLAANDLDSARGVMGKLESIKDSLPEALQSEIEALKEKVASMTGTDRAG